MSLQDSRRLSDEKEGRTLVGGSSSSSSKYKRIMDTSLLDEFGLSANLVRLDPPSGVEQPSTIRRGGQRSTRQTICGWCSNVGMPRLMRVCVDLYVV
ncbi:hypothetical protein FOZ63_007623 [Perkinsus olseni]|uniref:Uncharacterized protein n=1 Tax=Perkinsus olseni TaxID=32597 RepID=A0A7J6UBK5_PEROL|nr:hypothetical protein FOZ63_007623 [Perkinsus olseni]